MRYKNNIMKAQTPQANGQDLQKVSKMVPSGISKAVRISTTRCLLMSHGAKKCRIPGTTDAPRILDMSVNRKGLTVSFSQIWFNYRSK